MIALGGIGDADDEVIGAVRKDGVSDIERKGVITPLVAADFMAIDPNLGPPIDGAEM